MCVCVCFVCVCFVCVVIVCVWADAELANRCELAANMERKRTCENFLFGWKIVCDGYEDSAANRKNVYTTLRHYYHGEVVALLGLTPTRGPPGGGGRSPV